MRTGTSMNNALEKKWIIGIGGLRCATTWISQCLREHPEICMAPTKELHYFSHRYDRGIDWYLSNFKNCKNGSIQGEFSTSYLYFDGAAKRINNYYPGAKIIVSIRNPIERLISHYKYFVRYNYVNIDLPISDAIKSKHVLLEYGLYYKYLKPFYELFGNENVLVWVTESIRENPQKFVQELYSKVGVSSNFVPSVMTKYVSKGIIPRISCFESFRARLFCYLIDHGRSDVINFLKYSRIPELYRRLNNRSKKEPLLTKDLRFTLNSYYSEDIGKLRELTGYSLKQWRFD